jgi:hypothetical protein
MKQQQEFVVCSLCKFLLVKVVVLIGKRQQCVVSLAVGSDPLLLYMYMLYMFLLIWNNIRKCCCEKLWKQVCLFWYDETTTRTAAACCVRRFRALLVKFFMHWEVNDNEIIGISNLYTNHWYIHFSCTAPRACLFIHYT